MLLRGKIALNYKADLTCQNAASLIIEWCVATNVVWMRVTGE
jgi:hypothetical protein